MADDKENPESGAEEAKPPKIKAEDNPWYLLATLYGVPEYHNDELQAKNRAAWNRYFAANLDKETRTKLIEEKRHTADELTAFSPEELQKVASAFARRCEPSAKKELALPASDADIDFSNVKFEQHAFFDGYLFSRGSSFQSATFSDSHRAIFDGATFSAVADFCGATFSGGACFRGATFSGSAISARFDGATFSAGADFSGTTFPGWATFTGTTFSGWAIFSAATFTGEARFDGAAFCGEAHFTGSTFTGEARFDGATFTGEARFDGAAFSGEAHVSGAIFSGGANFGGTNFHRSSSFVNAEMKGETSFKDAMFKTEPPRFFEAKLHEGTVWRGTTWPRPRDKDLAGLFVDAYARLKREMDRLKKHDDELDFFALEMQARRVLLGPVRGLPIALYGLLSGYSRSYLRPLVALFAVAAIGAGAFWYFDARTYGEALCLSAANTLNVFGFRKDFDLAIDTPLAWLKVFSALQTILGTILLFLFGLGIRNKFRMK